MIGFEDSGTRAAILTAVHLAAIEANEEWLPLHLEIHARVPEVTMFSEEEKRILRAMNLMKRERPHLHETVAFVIDPEGQ